MSYTEEISELFVGRSMAEMAKRKVVLDVGGGERFTKWMKPYARLFDETDYRTFDFDSSTNPDVVGDIHSIPLADNSVDGVICSSVLEHVWNPVKAFSELERILRPGGLMFFYVPSIYPYHARKGHYPDHWRFFEDTIIELFKNFKQVEIYKRGGYFMALSFFVPMQHKLRPLLNFSAQWLDKIFRTDRRNTTSGFYVLAVKG